MMGSFFLGSFVLNGRRCSIVGSYVESVPRDGLVFSPSNVFGHYTGIVTGKQIGRASCRERVSSPV